MTSTGHDPGSTISCKQEHSVYELCCAIALHLYMYYMEPFLCEKLSLPLLYVHVHVLYGAFLHEKLCAHFHGESAVFHATICT